MSLETLGNKVAQRIMRFVIPVVFIIKRDWSVCICLTQLYNDRNMYRIYYIKNNYVFRRFTLAIFMLRIERNLVSSYTRLMWVVYSGEVRGEVGTRSRTTHPTQHMRYLVPTSPLTSPLYITHISRV